MSRSVPLATGSQAKSLPSGSIRPAAPGSQSRSSPAAPGSRPSAPRSGSTAPTSSIPVVTAESAIPALKVLTAELDRRPQESSAAKRLWRNALGLGDRLPDDGGEDVIETATKRIASPDGRDAGISTWTAQSQTASYALDVSNHLTGALKGISAIQMSIIVWLGQLRDAKSREDLVRVFVRWLFEDSDAESRAQRAALEDAKGRINQQEAQLADCIQKLADKDRDLKACREEQGRLATDLTKKDAALKLCNEELARLQADGDKLAQEIQKEAECIEKTKELEGKLAALEHANRECEDKLAELEGLKGALEQARKDLADCKEQEKELNNAAADLTRKLADDAAELEKCKETAEAGKEQLAEELKACQEERDRAHQDVAGKDSELAVIKGDLAKAQDELAKCEQEKEAVQAELAKCLEKGKGDDAEIAKLHDLLDKCNEMLAKCDEDLAKANALGPELEKARNEIDRLNKRLDECEQAGGPTGGEPDQPPQQQPQPKFGGGPGPKATSAPVRPSSAKGPAPPPSSKSAPTAFAPTSSKTTRPTGGPGSFSPVSKVAPPPPIEPEEPPGGGEEPQEQPPTLPPGDEDDETVQETPTEPPAAPPAPAEITRVGFEMSASAVGDPPEGTTGHAIKLTLHARNNHPDHPWTPEKMWVMAYGNDRVQVTADCPACPKEDMRDNIHQDDDLASPEDLPREFAREGERIYAQDVLKVPVLPGGQMGAGSAQMLSKVKSQIPSAQETLASPSETDRFLGTDASPSDLVGDTRELLNMFLGAEVTLPNSEHAPENPLDRDMIAEGGEFDLVVSPATPPSNDPSSRAKMALGQLRVDLPQVLFEPAQSEHSIRAGIAKIRAMLNNANPDRVFRTVVSCLWTRPDPDGSGRLQVQMSIDVFSVDMDTAPKTALDECPPHPQTSPASAKSSRPPQRPSGSTTVTVTTTTTPASTGSSGGRTSAGVTPAQKKSSSPPAASHSAAPKAAKRPSGSNIGMEIIPESHGYKFPDATKLDTGYSFAKFRVRTADGAPVDIQEVVLDLARGHVDNVTISAPVGRANRAGALSSLAMKWPNPRPATPVTIMTLNDGDLFTVFARFSTLSSRKNAQYTAVPNPSSKSITFFPPMNLLFPMGLQEEPSEGSTDILKQYEWLMGVTLHAAGGVSSRQGLVTLGIDVKELAKLSRSPNIAKHAHQYALSDEGEGGGETEGVPPVESPQSRIATQVQTNGGAGTGGGWMHSFKTAFLGDPIKGNDIDPDLMTV